MKNGKRILHLSCFFIVSSFLIMPVYAEVNSFKTDTSLYKKGDPIIFSGTVDDENVGEIVTVVVRDPENSFVVLRQGYVGNEKTFEIKINTKSDFLSHGIYNATAFFTDIKKGLGTTFDFSLDGSPVIHPTTEPKAESEPDTEQTELATSQSNITQENTTVTKDVPQESKEEINEKSLQDKIQEKIETAKKLKEAQINSIIKTVSNNNVNLTTRDNAVPTEVSTNDIESKILPENTVVESKTEKISEQVVMPYVNDLNLDSNLLYVIIGFGGIGTVVAISYRIKNKSKTKPYIPPSFKQPENRSSQRSAEPSEEDYALMILKNRLAKGEITLDEFNKLKKALHD